MTVHSQLSVYLDSLLNIPSRWNRRQEILHNDDLFVPRDFPRKP